MDMGKIVSYYKITMATPFNSREKVILSKWNDQHWKSVFYTVGHKEPYF